MRVFLLPDLGEGLDEVEIIAWLVNQGDHVVTDQPLLCVETDKAVVEIPSPRDGTIARLAGSKGELIKVGAPLVEFSEGKASDSGTVVGQVMPQDELAKLSEAAVENAAPKSPVMKNPSVEKTTGLPLGGQPVAPLAVRALARDLNVDLAAVSASGPGGAVTRQDVERAAKSLQEIGEGEALRGMRRAMARRMSEAHREVVPAGITDNADISDWHTGEDLTVRLVRALARACKTEKSLNAWFFAKTGVRHLIERIDIGIAVDTKNGLIVPVLHDVDKLSPAELRAALDQIERKANARKITRKELTGATITLSNFGMFGGQYAQLVIVPPQVAIVGAGRADKQVVVHHDKPAVRKILPLSLCFDHRIVTGGEGVRFLMALKNDLEQSQ